MGLEREIEIKQYAAELCRAYQACHLTQIPKRNEDIIKELMNKFGISYEEAKYCFEHNREIL